jgi:hypothetical protein
MFNAKIDKGAEIDPAIPPAGSHPPRPRLALNVGITGHRATILTVPMMMALGPKLDEVFGGLRTALQKLHKSERSIVSDADPILRLHTPLATGADQVAATSARSNGYMVRALLPFAPEEYRRDFKRGKENNEFKRQLEISDQIFALPGDRADAEAAYVSVGKAVIAASDILVAVWDGHEGNGPGGTAHVVDLALAASVPVIHVSVDRETDTVGDIRLITGGDALEPVVRDLGGTADYKDLIRDTLMPHTDLEREQIATYFGEIERTSNWRLEYPILLSVLRVKKLPSKPWKQSSVAHDIVADWNAIRDADLPGARVPLTTAYAWSNFLAIRYAQLFRSSHVMNYFLSAFAVILALFGLILPYAKIYLVVAELGTIWLLFHNTRAGTEGDWHRRWLQYRHLAESLRPLLYLKRTGMIAAPFRSDFVRGPLHKESGADWTRWYAAAIWREMDNPTGVMTPVAIRELANDVLTEQIVPQASYHHVLAERMHKLDHRLHEIGNLLIGAVIASCILYIIGYFFDKHLIKALTGLFIFLTAGLPAVGAAIFGMRGHGEHLLAASRSANTAAALQANATRLKKAAKLETTAVELQNTAAIMLADLNEWTATYRERSLEVPA